MQETNDEIRADAACCVIKVEEKGKVPKIQELDDGCYYVRLENGQIIASQLETWYKPDFITGKDDVWVKEFHDVQENEISEVISPVPSYEELQRLKEYEPLYHKAIGEIYKLRELLKESRNAFETYAEEDKSCELSEECLYAKHLLTKINEALK